MANKNKKSAPLTEEERKKKIQNVMNIGSTIGFIGGLLYAFNNKKKFWGYVGYSILGSLVVGTVAGLGARATIKLKKPTGSGTTTTTTDDKTSTQQKTTSNTSDELYDKIVKASGGKFKMAKSDFSSKYNSLSEKQKEVLPTMIDLMTLSVSPSPDAKKIDELGTKMNAYNPSDVEAVNNIMKG